MKKAPQKLLWYLVRKLVILVLLAREKNVAHESQCQKKASFLLYLRHVLTDGTSVTK